MVEEKRKFKRFEVSLPVEVEEKESNLLLKGEVKELSREGLKLNLPGFNPDINSEIVVKIKRPNKKTFVPLLGEVVWKKSTGERWEMGIKIKEMDKTVKMEILEFAYESWLKKFS
ncbi:MAG: hypothetical protein B6D56_06850 [Candidatus Omnitrophica bacterium 4484_70.1]|nr:MAG: hypothetical protein B6D56_06850 [Candidatus Omnitrophica bacterium 4484_70.1]